MTEIRVPALGEEVTEATIGRWFKKAGESVAIDEPLVELETDKVTIEVPAPSAGVLGEISAKDGDTVAVGALLGLISDEEEELSTLLVAVAESLKSTSYQLSEVNGRIEKVLSTLEESQSQSIQG